MEILKINEYSAIPVQYKEFIEAKSFGAIKLINQIELKDFCIEIIRDGLAFLGLKDSTAPEIIAFQTIALMTEINMNFNTLTKAEIKLAFKHGLRNKFGQVFGLNQKTYFQFLEGFSKMDERIESIKFLNKSFESKPIELSVDKKELILKNAALQYFSEYKKTNIFIRNWYIVHDYVNKQNGRIILVNGKEKRTLISSEEIRIKIKEDSYKEYTEGIERTAAEYKQQGMVTKSKQVLSILDNLDCSISYIILQKKNALKTYFDELITEGKELEL